MKRLGRLLAIVCSAAAVFVAVPEARAAINDCGTDDGDPGGMFNSQCQDLGIFIGDQVLDSGYVIGKSGNDREADVEAALADLGLFSAIKNIGNSDDVGGDFTFWDIDSNTEIDPAGTTSGGWKFTPGNTVIAFLTVKANGGFRLFQYSPLASDGRYSSLGIFNKGGTQADVSHLTFWALDISEPGSLAIFAFGVAGLAAIRRRKRAR